MKIVARIRQLIAAKKANNAPVIADVPLPIPAPPEETLHREIERPATQRPLQRFTVTTKKNGFLLEGEGIAVPITDPSEDLLRHELERLRSSGPSHLALIAPDGSYVQAAGNAKRMTVEGHFVGAQGITHVVLGRQHLSDRDAMIASTAGTIEVRVSEVWTALEALDLFSLFAATGSVAADLSQRDITSETADRDEPPAATAPVT